MQSHLGSAPQQRELEDPLAYLPCSTVMEFKKGEIVYGHDQHCDNLFLILSGAVKITRLADHGGQWLLDIYRADAFFGESAVLNLSNTAEEAVAYQKTVVMAWRTVDVEQLIMNRPRLAVALLQVFGQRSLGFTQRIEGLFFDPIERRLARTLIRFSENSGTPRADGSVVMEPLTHELLGQYVGTSREVVTGHMTKFRRLGYLRYSRKEIVLFRDALKSWLDERVVNQNDGVCSRLLSDGGRMKAN